MITVFHQDLTDIPGILVGHAQDDLALTGCTVVLCEDGAVAGVDQRGGAPGTRETDLLRPLHLVEKVHAILLSGGSAFGLDAATGVMLYLSQKKVGFDTGDAKVPIVPAAVIYDLGVGRSDIHPDAAMGYRACQAASTNPIENGSFGAGIGASVGKFLGMEKAMRGGIGSAAFRLNKKVLIAALVVANPLGEVFDPSSGRVLAGARSSRGRAFLNSLDFFRRPFTRRVPVAPNTVIGVVATNARLTKEQANWLAQCAQDGIARVIRPAHTLYDGDTLFCLATGPYKANINALGAYAPEVVSQAILNAITAATSITNLPAARDYNV